MTMIAAVPITMIELIWDKCITHLERVIKITPDDTSLEVIKKNLLSGNYMMVCCSRGAKITAVTILEVQEMETGRRILYIPIVGGRGLAECMERFLEIVNAIAIDMNCQEIRGMDCRNGAWARVLKKVGWYQLHTVIGVKVRKIEMNNVTNIAAEG